MEDISQSFSETRSGHLILKKINENIPTSTGNKNYRKHSTSFSKKKKKSINQNQTVE